MQYRLAAARRPTFACWCHDWLPPVALDAETALNKSRHCNLQSGAMRLEKQSIDSCRKMRAQFDEQRIRHRKLVWTSLLRASLQTRRRSCYSLITQPVHQFLFSACFHQSHHDKRSSSCSQQFYAERKCNRSTCKRNTHVPVDGHAIRNVSGCPSMIDV